MRSNFHRTVVDNTCRSLLIVLDSKLNDGCSSLSPQISLTIVMHCPWSKTLIMSVKFINHFLCTFIVLVKLNVILIYTFTMSVKLNNDILQFVMLVKCYCYYFSMNFYHDEIGTVYKISQTKNVAPLP